MTIPWTDRVKVGGQLSIYTDPSVSGAWTTVLIDAVREFNSLSKTKGLGITLTESRDAPAPRGAGGADVAVATANGNISCTYEGTTRAGAFDGSRMHGLTLQFQIDGKIEKAFVFLPRSPQVNTPRGLRAVGASVMKIIAIHEFVHACGLSNAEHSTDDLFQANPQVDPGNTAAGDKVRIRYGLWMPPLALSGSTVRHIKSVW